MIELKDEDDPMLFAVTLPSGRLVVQYMECIATLKAFVRDESAPMLEEIARAVRESARTPEVARNAPDPHLFAAFMRIQDRVTHAGNASGQSRAS